ncbi:MAG: TlpA family protein disulfide reductase [Chloroflexota bacterium]
MRSRRPVAFLALAAVLVAACSGGGSGSSPGGSADATGSAAAAACPTTPEPADGGGSWSGSQTPSVIPTVIDPGGTIACGANRVLVSFLDPKTNAPVASPDRSVKLAFYDLGKDPNTPVATVDADFIWAIKDSVGVYEANVTLPTSGTYGVEFTTSEGGSPPERIRVTTPVREARSVVGVGDRAPASDNPTLASVGGDVTKISTDATPVPAFYQTTVKDALAAKKPFVLVFATPKFCASSQCGPTLDRLKPIAAAHPGMTFINVEPYQLKDVDGQLQPVLTGDPAALTPVQATLDWRLPSEPWVFVVDKDGIVRASLMLIFSDQELEAAIKAAE